jgi:hypothetical protein
VGAAFRFSALRPTTFAASGRYQGMQYICDAPGAKTWFRIETEGEALRESDAMSHAVEKHFRQAWEDAEAAYRPGVTSFVEQNIGLKAHIGRTMPLFLTLRDQEGNALATAMLPPGGQPDPTFRIIIVGPANRDPYLEHEEAIRALGRHYGLTLDRARCYPYGNRQP